MTDSKEGTANRYATAVPGRLHPAAAAGARYAVTLPGRMRRAVMTVAIPVAMTAARPAARAWLRASLRRRVGAAAAIATLIGFLVIAGSLDTIRNLFLNPGFSGCGGTESVFPALPGDGCAYTGAEQLFGVILMIAAIALMIWSWWLLAGWALGPLSDTAETVRRLGPQNLGQRIGLTSADDQFKELADAIDRLAGKVTAQHEEQATRHQLILRGKLTAATVSGDPVLLERLIANLLSNAIKYNEPGGWIETEVRPGPDGLGGTLVVRNTGGPVPAEAVPVLFEPFRRLGTDRVAGKGGVGLGLAIVRSIVTAHQANLRAIPRQVGGLEITIDLPGK